MNCNLKSSYLAKLPLNNFYITLFNLLSYWKVPHFLHLRSSTKLRSSIDRCHGGRHQPKGLQPAGVAAAVRSDWKDWRGNLRPRLPRQNQDSSQQPRKIHCHQEIQAVQGRRWRLTNRYPWNHGYFLLLCSCPPSIF